MTVNDDNNKAGQFQTSQSMNQQAPGNGESSIQTCLWQQETKAGLGLCAVLAALFAGEAAGCYRRRMP